MEAAPRLPMLSIELQVSPESVQFSNKIKQYIANFYHEDPESYTTEIYNLESLRGAAVHPSKDVSGIQNLKKYYCQLHFLKSRFPMEEGQPCAVQFVWKDSHGAVSSGDVRLELTAIMYNIGALHTFLGSQDSRSTADGMKMACAHYQCAAWAFQTLKEKYFDMVNYVSSIELVNFYQQVCLAQAQECILEKSMLDNRKSTIISKVAVQVYDYYRHASNCLKCTGDDTCGRQTYKEWSRYLQFKVAYHRSISLLFQGQQAEELQKMGERVAFYQSASAHLEDARKLLSTFKGQQQKELSEALAFTLDVVEGKKKAAENENNLIYHEAIPNLAHLQEVKGASLVKGIGFNVNDQDVAGPDIFSRLVPMEAHEAASLYSEQKAQMLRRIGERVELKDQNLAEFMSSMPLDVLTRMHQASGIPQELIDRAAALSAKPSAIRDLVDAMAKLSDVYHEVESNLNEIDALLREEEQCERKYQEVMGKRAPSIVATDLAREWAKYKEAHVKANESNQTLSRAMSTHLENLKILQQPLRVLQQKLPSVDLPDAHIDETQLKNLETLSAKVDEMRTQRAMLWAQLREAVHNDDITSALVTKQANESVEELFRKELEKHQPLISLIEQNLAAQENIRKAFIDAYAVATNTRRYIQETIHKRASTIQALVLSYDSYDDLLSKANKGIEFYTKLDTNVSKLLQRVRSTINVQQEEREQLLAKTDAVATSTPPPATTPKLKDYLDARKSNAQAYPAAPNYGGASQNLSEVYVPAVRPAPLGSEMNNDRPALPSANETPYAYPTAQQYGYQYAQQYVEQIKPAYADPTVADLSTRLNSLLGKQQDTPPYYPQHYTHSSYIPQNYTPTSYSQISQHYNDTVSDASSTAYDSKAFTTTTNYYQTISHTPNVSSPSSTPETSQFYQQPDAQAPTNYYGVSDNVPPAQYYPTQGAGPYQYQSATGSAYYQQQQPVSTSQPEVAHPYATDTGYQYQATQQQQYFPPGYAPNYSSPLDEASQYYASTQHASQYHAQEYATSVRPDLSNYSYSVYTSPPYGGNAYKTQPDTPAGQNMATGLAQPSAASAKQSNVDLLSGLDFSVNQIPLTPSSATPRVPKETEKIAPVPESKVVAKKDSVHKILPSKALGNADAKALFRQELDRYEKYVETLTAKTLGGPTTLDAKWKEVQDGQDGDGQKRIVSVARCYPLKNRYPDILPYDHSRVELRSAVDDYINASHVSGVSPYGPDFIVAQAPLASTVADFWTMIREQQIELIFCVMNDNEIGDDAYWPKEKGRNLNISNMVLSLQSVVPKSDWVERLISITVPETKESWVVMHAQFTSWPGSLFPTSSEPFVDYVLELIGLFQQQKNIGHPVLVHCSSGIGRSGVVCLLAVAILQATNETGTLPDFAAIAAKLSQARKNVLRDREHLRFAYDAMLGYMRRMVDQGEFN
ncbi:tyrosine-protein phosphatase non-receptor type 23 isoform X2 [Cylas formicarius]|uniref:tyrosine-protein phosphatase non-receptor type 23 isoform X2 n=1 Tax=Cylas formicarius TaxID=197179 RepID=UPI0029587016|nr:tyrosine-protein phosphatase non-receptor type 23 isoform X2 [Cylas formicarius]